MNNNAIKYFKGHNLIYYYNYNSYFFTEWVCNLLNNHTVIWIMYLYISHRHSLHVKRNYRNFKMRILNFNFRISKLFNIDIFLKRNGLKFSCLHTSLTKKYKIPF